MPRPVPKDNAFVNAAEACFFNACLPHNAIIPNNKTGSATTIETLTVRHAKNKFWFDWPIINLMTLTGYNDSVLHMALK
jgi:hypothetical protein